MQITPIRNFYTPKYIAFKNKEKKTLQEKSIKELTKNQFLFRYKDEKDIKV